MQTILLDHNGQVLKERHALWWQRKANLLTSVPGAPLGNLWLPLAGGSLAQADLDLSPEMLDVDRLAGPARQPGPLELFGDRFRSADPYGKMPWVEAILGAPIHATIQGGSMRTQAFVSHWAQWEQTRPHFNQSWFDLLLRLTGLLVERSAGRVAVTQPTLRGPSDLAEAVLGPELMSFSMLDHPGSLHAFLEETTGVFVIILQALFQRIPRIEGGYLSPFGIWAPGSVVRTQCDATAFLSARHYTQWFLPHDLHICACFDYSFIHLHSVSLHTVDALLAQERPHAIQITLEARPKGPSLEAMLPTFRKILAVKPLLLEGKLSTEEVHWLQENLPEGGLAITALQNEW